MRVRNASGVPQIVMHRGGSVGVAAGAEADLPDGVRLPPGFAVVAGPAPPSGAQNPAGPPPVVEMHEQRTVKADGGEPN